MASQVGANVTRSIADQSAGLVRAEVAASPRPRVSVITLLWRNEEFVSGFLDSLAVAARRADHPVELVVIVNGRDGAAALAQLRQTVLPAAISVVTVELADNLGFAGGANVGCRAATGDVIVVANLDLDFDPRFFVELLAVAPTLQAASFVAPTVIDSAQSGSGDDCDQSTLMNGLVRRNAIHLLRPLGPAAAGSRVPGANGSCLVFGRPLLERRTAAVGSLFDEEYHSYFEDVDLFWWADREDIPTWFHPALRVVHHHGGSFEGKYRFQDRPDDLRSSILANYRITVWKHAEGWRDVAGWLAGEAAYLAMSVRAGGIRGVNSYAQSWARSFSRVRAIRARRGRLRR